MPKIKVKDNRNLVVVIEPNNSVPSIDDFLTAGCLGPDNWDSMVQKHLKKRLLPVKKLRNVEWQNYRHPEFLQSLTISVNERKYVKPFLKGGAVSLVNEILRERKTKQFNHHRDNGLKNYSKPEKIKA